MQLLSPLRSPKVFGILACSVALSLFLPAAFISITVIIFAGYCILCYDRQSKYDLAMFLPIILFVLAALWTTLSENSSVAIGLLLRKFPLILLPLALMVVDKNLINKSLDLVMVIFVLACMVCAFLCLTNSLMQVLEHGSFSVDTPDRKYYYFSNIILTEPIRIPPIYLSMYFNLAFIFSMESALIKSRMMKISISTFLVAFNLLIASKIGIIALFGISIAWLLMRVRKKLHRYTLAAVIIAGLLAAIFSFPFLRDRFITSTKFDYTWVHGHLWNSTTHRLAIWSCAWEAVSRAPVLGHGTGDGQVALETVYTERQFQWGLQEAYNAHSEFLNTQLDLGLPGLFVLILILAYPIGRAIKTRDTLLLSFILIAGTSFIVECVLLRQKGIVFFSLFYSLLILNNHKLNQK